MRKNVVFYSPHSGANMLRYIRPVYNMDDVHLIGLGQDSDEYLRFIGYPFNDYVRIGNADDPDEVETALKGIIQKYGTPHRLLNILEIQQQMISNLREKYGIPGIHSEVARRFRDKAYMKQVLQENGILCANYQRVDLVEDALRFVETYGFPVVIKPLSGAGAKSTYLVRTAAELNSVIAQMRLSPDNPAILEEFIEGEEGSFETMTLNGEIKFYSMTHYYPGPMDAMLNPWIQIIFSLNKDLIDYPDMEDVRQTGRAVIKAMGLGTSITHMEWFRRKKDGRIYVGEIAARPPGEPIPGCHNYAHDINLAQAWGEMMVQAQWTLKPERKWHVSCARLRAQGNGSHIREIRGLDFVRRKVGHLICDEMIAPVGWAKTDSYMGESYIFCRGKEYDEVFDATRLITEAVRIYC